MCFSAAASFTTSGVLLVTGVVTVSSVTKRSQILLATTPLLFAIQQFSEGVLWLSFTEPRLMHFTQWMINIFVLFGQIVWPVWVPLANRLIETKRNRMQVLDGMIVVGGIISGYLIYQTVISPVSAEIRNHHIHYVFNYSGTLINSFNLTYLIPTVFSHFASSHRKIQILGILTFISYLISKIYYEGTVFSVWCFFAAALSVWTFVIIRGMKNEEKKWFIQL